MLLADLQGIVVKLKINIPIKVSLRKFFMIEFLLKISYNYILFHINFLFPSNFCKKFHYKSTWIVKIIHVL